MRSGGPTKKSATGRRCECRLEDSGHVPRIRHRCFRADLGDRHQHRQHQCDHTYRKGNLGRSWRRLKVSPLADPAIWAQLKDYNRADFHPDDSDTTELVESWRVRLYGEDGTLNGKLTRAAA